MKFVLPLALLGSVFFTSCKKDYTCVCTVSSSGINTSAETTLKNTSKKDAKKACEMSTQTAGVTTTCELK